MVQGTAGVMNHVVGTHAMRWDPIDMAFSNRRLTWSSANGRPLRELRSDVEVAHVQRVLFDELAARFDLIAHQDAE